MPPQTKNNIRQYLLLVLLSLLPLTLAAQSDSLHVELRSFSQESIQEYKADSAFDYDKEVSLQEDSTWERIKRWLLQKLLRSLFGDNNESEALIFYILLAALVVFIILKLANVSISTILRGNPPSRKSDALAFSSLTAQIYEANFDSLVQEALAQARYEQALRLLFLKALQMLSEKKYIQWKEPKTNGEYLRELATHPALQEDFQQLRLWFDYTFYGDFHLDEALFKKVQPLFQAFYQKL